MKLEDAIKKSFTNKLFLIIDTIKFTLRDQNNLIMLPNVHKSNSPLRPILETFSQQLFMQPCKISGFHS